MPRVSRKKTRRGGGRRKTRRMKGGVHLPRDTRQPINEDIFAQPQQLQRIPSGVMNLNSSSDKPIKQNDYDLNLTYLDKRITFEVGSKLIHIRQDIKKLSNEMEGLKKENNKLKEILISLGVD